MSQIGGDYRSVTTKCKVASGLDLEQKKNINERIGKV